MTKERVMTYMKPKLAYDVEVFKNCFSSVFEPVDEPNKRFVFIKNSLKEAIQPAFNKVKKNDPHHEYILLNDKDCKFLTWQYQLVGFSNSGYDDYMLKAILEGKSTREVYEMSRLHIEENVRLYTKGYPALFGTFDIRSVLPAGVSLKQLASDIGRNVWEFDDVDWDYDGEFDVDLLAKMLGYNANDTDVTKEVYELPTIQGAYRQHVAFIENYLPGKDWMISRSDASLAESAITDNGRITVERKRKFDFILNGHNVLSVIPPEWRNEYYRYAKEVEIAFVDWEKLVEQGVDPTEAYKTTIGDVPLPEIDTIWLDDYFGLQPSVGGIHSTFKHHPQFMPEGTNTVRSDNVEHFDIGGAYGSTAKAKNLYGAAQSRYDKFMDDKFRYKSAAKSFKKNKGLAVSKLKAGVKKHFGIDLHGNSYDEMLVELTEGVSASKLGTNSPTGKADSPVSKLYNPIGMIEVRLILQCLFYDILEKLINVGCVAFSANTDGFFLNAMGVDVAPFVKAWESKWGLTLDYDHIDTYIAKSDNDRILIVNGEVVEASGDDLVHLNYNPKKSGKKPRIVDHVLVQKLVHPDMSIHDLLVEAVKANRVDLFAWTLKATKNHIGVINKKIAQKVNRVLLTTEGDEIGNYSITKDKIEAFLYFPNCPVEIINDGYPEKLPDNLNIDAYEQLITQVYESHWN